MTLMTKEVKIEKKVFHCISMGDWGYADGEHGYQMMVARQMHAVALQSKISAVLCAGDNFYEYGVNGLPPKSLMHLNSINTSQGIDTRNKEAKVLNFLRSNVWKVDMQWVMAYEDVYRRHDFNKGLAKIPFYLALGNHDYYGAPEAQVANTFLDTRKLWIMPSNYYVHNFRVHDRKICLIVIDTMVLKTSGDKRKEHRKWFVETLKENQDASCIMVMGHFPLYSNGGHCAHNLEVSNSNIDTNRVKPSKDNVKFGNRNTDGFLTRNTTTANMNDITKPNTIKRWLIETMIEYKVDLYINGHNHNLEFCTIFQDKNDNGRQLHCITTGAASKMYEPRDKLHCMSPIHSTLNHIFRRTNSVVSPNPIYAHGFVEHEISGNCIINRFHYIRDYKDHIWETAVVETKLKKK